MVDDDAPEHGLHALVARARVGDVDAWELLYRRVHPQLQAYARRRIPDRADDVVSETMSRAMAKIDSFTWQGAGFDAWLTGICRNVVHEQWRAAGRDLPDADPAAGRADLGEGPDEAAVAADRAAALRVAFGRLSEEDRELLELRVVAGMGARQVGEVVGKEAGAVRMAQSRALSRLRGELERMGHD